MHMYQKYIIPSLLVFMFLLPSAAFSETRIYLKDGRVIKVESFWREHGQVKYENFGGIIGIPLKDVDRIITPGMEAFEKARKEDSVKSYEMFLQQFPRSELADQAVQRIKELQFETVKQIDSSQVYLDYIRRNPSSIYLQEAKDRAEILIFQEAVRGRDGDKYNEYLAIYPQGIYAEASKKALILMQYEFLKEKGSLSEMEAFLRAHPENHYVTALEERMGKLKTEAKARAKAVQEKERKARELQALEAQQKKAFWTRILAGTGVLALAVLVGFFFIRRKRVAAQAAMVASAKEALSNEPFQTYASDDSVRYEDLIGVPRKDDDLSLPGIDGNLNNGPMSLPEPGQTSDEAATEVKEFVPDADQVEEVPSFEDETVISMGFEGSGESDSDVPDKQNEIDLSDHETEFKLELEDVPDEGQEETVDDMALAEEMIFSDDDIEDVFDDEEMKRRRGGSLPG